jgi:hypothetical protein
MKRQLETVLVSHLVSDTVKLNASTDLKPLNDDLIDVNTKINDVFSTFYRFRDKCGKTEKKSFEVNFSF